MRAWTRAMVGLLGLLTATLGVWAGSAPRSFYDDGPIPLIDTGWVAMLPPYNQHLVRDYGFMNLAVTVIFVVAAIRLTPVLVRAATAALFAFGVPHTVYHSLHLDHMSTGDAVMLTLTNSVLTVVLPAVVFWMAGRLDRAESDRSARTRVAGGPSGESGRSRPGVTSKISSFRS